MTTTERNLISEETKLLMGELKVLIQKYVNPIEIVLCKECRREIKQIRGINTYYPSMGYCDELCYENNKPQVKTRECAYCGGNTYARRNKDGHSTGVFTKYCADCQLKGRHRNTGKKLPSRREYNLTHNKQK